MKPLHNLKVRDLTRVLAGRFDIAMCSVGIAEAAHAVALGWMKKSQNGWRVAFILSGPCEFMAATATRKAFP
jgi:alkylation response protein AidB-like acyl-CoA dehydrogenase